MKNGNETSAELLRLATRLGIKTKELVQAKFDLQMKHNEQTILKAQLMGRTATEENKKKYSNAELRKAYVDEEMAKTPLSKQIAGMEQANNMLEAELKAMDYAYRALKHVLDYQTAACSMNLPQEIQVKEDHDKDCRCPSCTTSERPFT